MRNRLVAGAVLCSALAAVPQDVYVTLVQVHFFVTDRKGAFVTDLRAEDLAVFDNDRPQKITTLSQNVQSPVSVALVLDRSESVKDRFSSVLDAAASFANSIIRDRDDQGSVIAFDSKVYLLQNWTADPSAIVAAIHKLTAVPRCSTRW
jgi:Ca-activated chloride channel family protein